MSWKYLRSTFQILWSLCAFKFSRYVRQRMGRNKLKSFGPVICRMAMLVHIRSGSFFFKALGITLLFMAGFPDDLVQKETKYRNLDLLQKYYRYISCILLLSLIHCKCFQTYTHVVHFTFGSHDFSCLFRSVLLRNCAPSTDRFATGSVSFNAQPWLCRTDEDAEGEELFLLCPITCDSVR